MHVKNHIFFIILLYSTFNSLQSYECQRKKQKEMSRTKCVAGRRFFARFDQMPEFSKMLSEKYLIQPYVYPWIAEIVAHYAGKTITCTGTLINDRYIITAQHCVSPPLEAQHLTVTLGFGTLSDSKQLLESTAPTFLQKEVLDIILHPEYDYSDIRTASNDLALLKINPVAYSKTIYPIQLPTIADMYYDMSDVIAESVGWEYPTYGAPKTGHSFSNKFHKMSAQIISNKECSDFNVYYKHAINPEVLCTLRLNTGKVNHGPCNGDTGAPLMIENHKRVYNVTILVGIVSWSAPKNKPCIWYGSPVVYVRIDNKLQWIMDNTKDALYCRY